MGVSTEGAQHVALAVASRRRLLEVLRSVDEPLDVAALAQAVGLHVTTARFHLDVLERAGLVRRTVERGGRPGRPRQLYSVVAVPKTSEGHRQLAGVLAGALAADPDTGPRWAEQAGRRWATDQLPVPRDSRAELSWADGMRQVGELFTRLGFSPRVVDGGQQRHLELHSCPFRDLARAYPHIVCTAHLGLLRGALDQLRSPVAEQARLRPFVEPDLCIADVPIPPRPGDQPVTALPDLTGPDDVEFLVRTFYARAFADPLLGPIFVDVVRMDLDAHLPVMCDFWQTVLFRAGLYRRNALQVHTDLHAIFPLSSQHFARWLALWVATVDDHFAGEKAELAKTQATRIGYSISRRLLGESGSEFVTIQRRPPRGNGASTAKGPE